MEIDAQTENVLRWLRQHSGPTVRLGSAEDLRAAFDRVAIHLDPDPPRMAETISVSVPGVDRATPSTLFVPDVDDPSGLLVWFHGGGWIRGGLRSHDAVFRRIAAASGASVLGVGFRLAPEAQFPAQIEDAEATLAWVLENAGQFGVNDSVVAIGGDSTGGTLGLVAGMELSRRGAKAAFQILCYPSLGPEIRSESFHDFAEDFGFSADDLGRSYQLYLDPTQNHADPRISPLLTPDLHEAIPTAIVVAGFDPLRDEAIALAGLLQGSGVETEVIHEVSLIHGFLQMGGSIDAAKDAIARVGMVLKRRFRQAP